MTTPVRYPDTNGFRAGFQSTQIKIAGEAFVGFKSIEGKRTRNRGIPRGANSDPLGKTRGENEYSLKIEVYVAEFKVYLVDRFGAGYGDVQFSVEVAITENGYDTQVHRATGCTVDSTEFSFSQGTDALTKTIELGPTKILFCGVDDNANPLKGATAIG